MRRDLFTDEHEMFRAQFKRFAAREVEPKIAKWNHDGITDRDTWRRMGAEGFLGPCMPEQYGGGGGDFRYDAIVMEELAYVRAHGLMTAVHSSICMPYLLSYGSEEQKRRYLPPAIAGEMLLGICMTEPGTGSDLASIQTRALRDGDHYVVNGAKTFISIGQLAGLFIVVAKTDPAADPPHKGISLLLVEADTPGCIRGRKLEKLGLAAQDTSEIFFEDCRVPRANLLGEEGRGFKYLMEKLQQERLCIGIGSVTSCRRALDDTVAYVKQRHAFGRPIAAFQLTQNKLVDALQGITQAQLLAYQLGRLKDAGRLRPAQVSLGKRANVAMALEVARSMRSVLGANGISLEHPVFRHMVNLESVFTYEGTHEIHTLVVGNDITGLSAYTG